MKRFISGVIITKEEFDGDIKDYDTASFCDYAIHALFDITDPANPKTIICNDNIHSPVESDIECFMLGVEYMDNRFTHYQKNLWVIENGNPYDPKYADLVLVEGVGA